MCCFLSVFVTFPYGVLGQVWYLIVSIPGLCLHYFVYCKYMDNLKGNVTHLQYEPGPDVIKFLTLNSVGD